MDHKRFEALFGQFKQLHRKEELHQLVNVVEWFKPQTILELGVCHGGSFKMWEYILPSTGLLVGVDRLSVVQWDWKNSPKDVQYIQGEIASRGLFKEVYSLTQNWVDFLYIDSDHYYEGVKKQFELYVPLVREGGIVAFHDIRDSKGSGYGVGKHFNELKEHYGWLEILVPIAEPLLGADGIGVIFK